MTMSENQLVRSDTVATESTAISAGSQSWLSAAPRERRVQIGIGDLVEVPFMHKRLILGCILGSMVLGWLALLVWPRRYESEAKFVVRIGRESVSLDPTATTSQTLMLQKTQEEEINSALELLGSRSVAEQVVDEIGAEAILDGFVPGDGSAEKAKTFKDHFKEYVDVAKDGVDGVLRTGGLKDDISDRELAVRKLHDSVKIFAPKKSNVITIYAESKSPEMAQLITLKATDAFLEHHMDISQTKGSLEFFEEQSDVSEQSLNALIDERSSFMQENQIVSVEANRMILKEQIIAVERDLTLSRGLLEQKLAEVNDLNAKLALTEDEIVASKLEGSDQTWSGMRQRVYELELQEQSLAAIYTGDHQKLRAVREQLEGAQEILAEMQAERVDFSRTPNPEKRRMQAELQQLQTAVVGLRSIIKEKQQQLDEINAEVDKLHQDELHLTQLDREIGIRSGSLATLRSKLEEARVIDELADERISNISVFQPATFVERPTSPKKKIVALGVVFLGVVGGIGLAFLKQGASKTLRTPADVETQLATSVAANIPYLKRLSRKRRFENPMLRAHCRRLISEVLLSRQRRGATGGISLGVIGIDSGCGASTLAANLALVSQNECGLKTVLVDADARQRTVSDMFGLNGNPGLVELVHGNASHDECKQLDESAGVDLVASSSSESDERLNVSAEEIVAALSAYQHSCDLMIVDLPPASQPDQAISLARHLDSVLVVVESEKTESDSAGRFTWRLVDSDADLIGVVLNKSKRYVPWWMNRYFASNA